MIRAVAEPIALAARPVGMLRRILALAAFSSLMTVAAPVTQVFACSCMEMTQQMSLANADVAWVGVLTGVDRSQIAQPDAGNDPVRYTFAVESTLKGAAEISVDVRSPTSSAGCGMEFALAQRWRMYAHRDEIGQLHTGLCSGNELLAEQAQIPAPTPAPLAPTAPTAQFVAIVVVLLLTGISGWAFTRRGRSVSV